MDSMISPDLKKRRFSQSGYMLFEIMLVLGIIAVLVGSAIYMLVGNIDVAKEQRHPPPAGKVANLDAVLVSRSGQTHVCHGKEAVTA